MSPKPDFQSPKSEVSLDAGAAGGPLSPSIPQLQTCNRWRGLAWRYAQFCVVGGSGVVVDMAVLHLLSAPALLAWNLNLSKAIAAEAALVSNFVGNDLWTFGGMEVALGGRARLGRFLKFNLICLAGIGWSVLLLNLQVTWLHLNLYVANFLAIALVSGWNFWLNLRFGWGAGRAGGVPIRREASTNSGTGAGVALHGYSPDPLGGGAAGHGQRQEDQQRPG